jgi:hypothetical protein
MDSYSPEGRNALKHFSMSDWIDFARHTEDRAKTIAMQQHLDEGCAKCLKNLEIWRYVMDFANQENDNQPSETSVLSVRAGFALRNVIPFPTGNLEMANLVFDSAEQALVAGVRGSAASARQLLYKLGSICIDLRVQPTPGADSVVLVGQLLDSTRPTHGIGDILVSLLSQGSAISHKKTNDFGEFDFGFESQSETQLAFGIEKSRTIVVPVPNVTAEAGYQLT